MSLAISYVINKHIYFARVMINGFGPYRGSMSKIKYYVNYWRKALLGAYACYLTL